MKKFLMILSVVVFILGVNGIASATFIQTVDIYDYSVGGSVNWNHTYDFSEPNPIDWATLTIVADDIDAEEQDSVYINGNFLGYLNTLSGYTNWGYTPGPGGDLTSTTFSLDVSWLDFTMPISISIESSWGSEIETSTLTVQGAETAPCPRTFYHTAYGCWPSWPGGFQSQTFQQKELICFLFHIKSSS